MPHTTRTVGVAPCIGADDIQYVLGWCDDKSKPGRVEQCHASFIGITKAWAEAYPDETAAQAIVRFYASGQASDHCPAGQMDVKAARADQRGRAAGD